MQNTIKNERVIRINGELITRSEYERKRRANMTEEDRLKRAENKRKQRANKTEEQRLKIAEYERKRRANLTEEQRMKVAEYGRKRRANISDEEQMKLAENERKRRATLTKEQRLKIAEKERIRRANMTDEQRLRLKENKREKRANMTEEERLKRLESKRKWRASISEERRMRLKESARNWYVKMTDEDRIKKREDARKRYATATEEERLRRLEKKRTQYANMTAIERTKKIEYIHDMTGIRNQSFDNCLPVLTKEQLTMNKGYNPLLIIINSMINSNMNVVKLASVSKNLLQEILQFIGIDCTYTKSPQFYKSAIEKLTYEIYMTHLLDLLIKWEGWVISDNIKYDALFFYLKNNVLHFKLQLEELLQNGLNDFFNLEYVIKTSCSFKQLKTLFYHSPQNYIITHPDNGFVPDSICRVKLTKYIINLPHVSTRIVLPYFSMTHQNNHFDEYTLSNMTNGLSVNKNLSFVSQQMTNTNGSKLYSNTSIKIFLNQLIKNISVSTIIEKKSEILSALMIFENDLAHFPDVIESNYKYNRCYSTYPYARYLGCSDNDDICISMSDQKALKDSELNVRLQQVRYPNVAFILENFNPPYKTEDKERRYIFDDKYLRGINTCITYDCLLCNEGLGSISPSHIISEHFSKYHGLEPNWECTNCFKSYTNDYLLDNNWKHDC